MEITKKEFSDWLPTSPIPYQISGDQIHFQTSKESNQFSVEKIKCRVKLFSKFEMKLKGKVLGDDAINQKGVNTLQKIKSWHWRFTNNLGELIQI
jgi:hypothetical protein